MKQNDVFILHGGGVGTDAESVDVAIGLDDLEYELLFGFRDGFPSGAELESLLGGGHFAGESGDDGGGFEVVGGLSDGGPGIAGGDDEKGNAFAETFGDGNGAGEEGLLVIAENLLRGKAVGGGTELADAGGHDDDILLAGVAVIEHPAQVIQSVVIADGYEKVAGTNAERVAFDGVTLEQLKMIFHL